MKNSNENGGTRYEESVFIYQELKQLLIDLITVESSSFHNDSEYASAVMEAPEKMTWLFGLSAEENHNLNAILFHHDQMESDVVHPMEPIRFS